MSKLNHPALQLSWEKLSRNEQRDLMLKWQMSKNKKNSTSFCIS